MITAAFVKCLCLGLETSPSVSAIFWFLFVQYFQRFINDTCSRLDALEHNAEDVDESWTVLRDTVHNSAMDSLGPVSRKRQDWFDENDKEIKELLEEKHQKHKAYFNDNSSVSSKTAYSKNVRQSRLGSETCKTLGWAQRLMKSSPLQTERIWRSSLMHLRQCMDPTP